jgi:hypothetical protein
MTERTVHLIVDSPEKTTAEKTRLPQPPLYRPLAGRTSVSLRRNRRAPMPHIRYDAAAATRTSSNVGRRRAVIVS